MRRLLIILSVMLLAAGCRTGTQAKPVLLKGIHYPLLPPASFGHPAEVEHMMEATYRGRSLQIHTILHMDNDQVLVVGLTPAGTRAFTIRYDGNKVEVDNPNGPKLPFPPEFIIADIQEMFWPELPERDGWRVIEDKSVRRRHVLFGGREIARIIFKTEKPGGRIVEMENLEYHYRLRIQILEDGEQQ